MSEIRYVRIGDLRIDPSYQRADNVSKKIVDNIAKNFDPRLVGVIKLNEREDGSLWIVDGMHRYYGCRERFGDNYVMRAEVEAGLSPHEEARIFVGQINRMPISTYHKHRARVVAGDATAMAIDAILADYGVEFIRSDGKTNGIKAVRAIEKAYETFGQLALREALSIMQDAGKLRSQNGVSGEIVLGLTTVVSIYGKQARRDRLVNKIKNADVHEMRRDMSAVVKAGMSGRPYASAQVIVNLYNFGLHEASRLPHVRDIGPSAK